jgi:hypothetical protein
MSIKINKKYKKRGNFQMPPKPPSKKYSEFCKNHWFCRNTEKLLMIQCELSLLLQNLNCYWNGFCVLILLFHCIFTVSHTLNPTTTKFFPFSTLSRKKRKKERIDFENMLLQFNNNNHWYLLVWNVCLKIMLQYKNFRLS